MIAISQFQSYQLGRINLHVCELKSAQTIHSSFHIVQPINRRLLTYNSFIPYMLSSTSKLYPSRYELHKKLYDLYGTIVFPSVTTLANFHVMSVLSSTPNLSFMNETCSTVDLMTELLLHLIFDPNVHEDKFDDVCLKNMKSKLQNELEALQSSTARHAFERCVQSAADESISSSVFGNLGELKLIDNEILYKRYLRLMKTSDFQMYVAGNVQAEAVKCHIEQILSELTVPERHPGASTVEVKQSTFKQESQTIKVVKDIKPIHQDMLTVAMRLDGNGQDESLMLEVFDWIFSGSFYSRMYVRLREENGLAYYIKSWADTYTGLYVVQLGIDGKDIPLALNIIMDELEELKTNGSSEQELVDAKKGLINRFMKSACSPRELVDMHLNHLYINTVSSPHEYIKQLMDIDHVMFRRLVNNLKLNTIHYFGREDVELIEVCS